MDLREELGKEIDSMKEGEERKRQHKEKKEHKKEKKEKKEHREKKAKPEDKIPDKLPEGITKDMVMQLHHMEVLSKKLHEQAIREGRVRPAEEVAAEEQRRKEKDAELQRAKEQLREAHQKRQELLKALQQVRDDMTKTKSPEELRRLAAERERMLEEMKADMEGAKADVKLREEEKERNMAESAEHEKEIAALEEGQA